MAANFVGLLPYFLPLVFLHDNLRKSLGGCLRPLPESLIWDFLGLIVLPPLNGQQPNPIGSTTKLAHKAVTPSLPNSLLLLD